MIPAYSEQVKITVVEDQGLGPIEEQIKQLREQVRQLSETVEFVNRERSRLKAEVESLKSMFNKG
jgi:predicted RNase H-like nuclease (RuvC/YqgF family)